ncbi:MAG: WG repeat-containing protein [Bacteroidales bacterium]|nr:WG repeat-containing protein [Bacteroidales bacterium]
MGNQWLVEPIYEYGSDFKNGMAMVRLNGLFGFINTKGVLVVKNIYNSCTSFDSEGTATGKIGETTFLIDKEGHQFANREEYNADKNLRMHEQKRKSVYAASDYVPSESPEGKWGYKLLDNWVIQPRFEQAGDFCEGIAPVKLGGKWGFIGKDGKSVIPYKYEFAAPLQGGLARVSLMGKYGFIDKNGEVVIPYKYAYALDFEKGLAAVRVGAKISYVDKTGEAFDSREDMLTTFSAYARHFVETDINQWQRKGKYEKIAHWQNRVTEAKRKARIDSLLKVAAARFIEKEEKKVVQEHELVEYDAEHEVFFIYDKRFKNILVPVPINEAERFENEFSQCVRTDKYYVNGDNIGLKEATFTTPQGKRYTYSNTASMEFASVDIDYNFEKINVETSAVAQAGGNNVMASKKLKVGQSDVDTNIPQTRANNEDTFVLIISNENYSLVAPVPFAINDGKTFEEYCLKTLGVPKANIKRLPDATAGLMLDAFAYMEQVAKSYNGEAKLLVYYAGHGIPDESNKDAYLLPVDSSPKSIRSAIKLSDMYASLAKYPTRSTMVFLDACFSGAKRDGQMLASARGVALKAKVEKPGGNMVVFSAASGDETAYPYQEKGHGLFSYFLFKKLQETKGEVSLGELADYLTSQVGRNAIVINQKSQTPSVIPSDSLADSWKELTLQ